jgi:LuxR family transcriptional regulator, maltose regulon positive regulatory protein
MLVKMAAAAQAGGRTGRLIEILVLDALSQFAGGAGQPLPALDVLQRALQLGQPENYTRTFLDEGESLARLLRLGSQNGQWRTVELQAYVDRLLAAYAASVHETTTEGHAAGLDQSGEQLIEPLSDREVEVLHLLEQGLSNREIAERLYISTGTVKTHAHNIYNKLCVKNRTQAIARARALGILRNT